MMKLYIIFYGTKNVNTNYLKEKIARKMKNNTNNKNSKNQ